MFGGASLCFGQTETTCPAPKLAGKAHPVGLLMYSHYNQLSNQETDNHGQRKKEERWTWTDQQRRSSCQGSHREIEISYHGKNGNRGLLPVEIKIEVGRRFCQ